MNDGSEKNSQPEKRRPKVVDAVSNLAEGRDIHLLREGTTEFDVVRDDNEFLAAIHTAELVVGDDIEGGFCVFYEQASIARIAKGQRVNALVVQIAGKNEFNELQSVVESVKGARDYAWISRDPIPGIGD